MTTYAAKRAGAALRIVMDSMAPNACVSRFEALIRQVLEDAADVADERHATRAIGDAIRALADREVVGQFEPGRRTVPLAAGSGQR